jgi:serine protease Do
MKRLSTALFALLIGLLLGGLLTGRFLQGQDAKPVAIPKELTSYRDVVKKVLPAVVSIESRVKARKVRGEGDDSSALGFGSGFIIDPKGIILTNYHVVDGADRLEVTLMDGRRYVSRDVKSDPKTDLAVVRITPKKDLPYLELGDSDQMEIGDRVLAVGAPFGLTGSVTSGIISAKNRNLRVNMYEDFLQTDAAINPGNSGGPLVNLEGKVIGINSAIKSRTGGFQGVGLAIASNMVRKVKDQLLKEGVVRRGYLGVQVKDVDNEELATKLGLKEPNGVLIENIFEDTPSAKAGLKKGDVIVSLGGKPIKNSRSLQYAVSDLPIGKPVTIDLFRDGKEETRKVTIEEQPQDYGTRRPSVPDDDK